MRRYAVLAPQHFSHDAKTAHGVIRYAPDPVVAVIDPDHTGKRVREVVSYLDSDAPIVATVEEALKFAPSALLIGTAPQGGSVTTRLARRDTFRNRRATRDRQRVARHARRRCRVPESRKRCRHVDLGRAQATRRATV